MRNLFTQAVFGVCAQTCLYPDEIMFGASQSSECVRLFPSLCLFLSQAEMSMYKDVCYYMLFALAAYGWPMYLMRKPACGLCHLASSCP